MKLQNYKILGISGGQRYKWNTSDRKINYLYITQTKEEFEDTKEVIRIHISKTVMNIYKYDVIMVSTQEINDNRPNIVLNKKY